MALKGMIDDITRRNKKLGERLGIKTIIVRDDSLGEAVIQVRSIKELNQAFRAGVVGDGLKLATTEEIFFELWTRNVYPDSFKDYWHNMERDHEPYDARTEYPERYENNYEAER